MICCLLTTPLAGCSRNDGGSAAAAEALQVVVKTLPAVPHAGQKAEFVVSVLEQGRPVQEAGISLYLEMQDMDHGEHVVTLHEAKPGEYRGKGSFPMAGEWVAHVRVERERGTESANAKLVVSD
ncbi:FixH family protein [Tumebacillus avium]|uniref:FixH family protein n=1 Tax=Tumebacillus avium TaxID=1903704 RepID=UPI0012FD5880|nr:FixH family protein [Tumebacillus avium]